MASLGCTLPIFLTISTQSLATLSWGEALAVFLTYGLGMGWIVMVVPAGTSCTFTVGCWWCVMNLDL